MFALFTDPMLQFKLSLLENAMALPQQNTPKMKPKYANEFLQLIDSATGDDKIAKLKQYATYPPLNYLLSLNFNDSVTLDLPIGVPPHKRNSDTHPDLYAALSSSIKRLQICIKSNKNASIPKRKKEQIFIQLMESLNEAEANILIACKDKQLQLIYPTITKALLIEHLPGLIGVSSTL